MSIYQSQKDFVFTEPLQNTHSSFLSDYTTNFYFKVLGHNLTFYLIDKSLVFLSISRREKRILLEEQSHASLKNSQIFITK